MRQLEVKVVDLILMQVVSKIYLVTSSVEVEEVDLNLQWEEEGVKKSQVEQVDLEISLMDLEGVLVILVVLVALETKAVMEEAVRAGQAAVRAALNGVL